MNSLVNLAANMFNTIEYIVASVIRGYIGAITFVVNLLAKGVNSPFDLLVRLISLHIALILVLLAIDFLTAILTGTPNVLKIALSEFKASYKASWEKHQEENSKTK